LYTHLFFDGSPEILLSGGKNGLKANPEQFPALKFIQMQRAGLSWIPARLAAGFNGGAS
jgi:hypothetical protein